MRRTGRILFTVLSAISLLLCVATCVLWVRSYRIAYFYIWYEDPLTMKQFMSYRGQLWFSESRLRKPSPAFAGFSHENFGSLYSPTRTIFGFEWYHTEESASVKESFDGAVPHWFLFLITITLPLVKLRQIWRVRRNSRVGLCPKCRYDLRASPDGCPECGTAIAAKDSTSVSGDPS